MTKFILVRHGEPTYDEVVKLGFKGTSLAPLTQKGISNENLKQIGMGKILCKK